MCGCKGAPVLTVGNDADGVERMLEEGSLRCPWCGGRLARWGHARERTVFGPGRKGWQVRPRRSRCTVCRVTHVLLPARLLLRRADEAPVIGAALASAARGQGRRRVAAELGVLAEPVLAKLQGRVGRRLAIPSIQMASNKPPTWKRRYAIMIAIGLASLFNISALIYALIH